MLRGRVEGKALTAREEEIFGAFMDGLPTKEIAARFVISPRTVESTIWHVKKKLGARSRAHAVVLYLRARHRAQATAGVAY